MEIQLLYKKNSYAKFGFQILLLSLCVCHFLDIQAQDKYDGLARTNATDIWANTLTGNQFTESWTYQFYFDNGVSLYAIFTVSNLGALKASVSGVQVSLYNFNGKEYQINREYPLKHLIQDSTDYRFNINPRQDNIWFAGKLPAEHQLYINTDKDGNRFKIHLAFSNIQEGFKLDQKHLVGSESEGGLYVHIPYAEVSGYVGINEDSLKVTGKAYMDHSWLFDKSSDHYKAAYRFVHLENQNEWALTYAQFPKKYDNDRVKVGFEIQKNASISRFSTLYNADDNLFQVLDKRAAFPDSFVLATENNEQIIISQKEEIGRFSMFDDLGWFARKAIKRLAGGELVYMRGTATQQNFGKYPRTQKGYYHYAIIK
jgi:hypothetical protein